MTNIFREMLKQLPKGNIEIMPDDPKDKEVSKQMGDLINWKVVESKSDQHPECGYPLGQILCRSLEEAEDYINKCEFKDCFIKDYGKP